MRRNFTQLFMSVALFVGFTTMSYAQCDEPIPAPEGAIYSWQFDGGLDGWRATNSSDQDVDQVGTFPTAADGTVFGWVWDAEGRVDGGGFNSGNDGTTSFIESPSVCNGAMVFNSDFYDNAGMGAANFAGGVCPSFDAGSFCEGWLKSPAIDLSGFDGEVALQFNQALRQFTSEYFVYLSKDGGMSYFDTIQFNTEVPTNSNHLLSEVLTIPLCGLAREADVRIDFLYRGSYYYFAIDDIAILPSLNPDVRVNSNFVAVSSNFGTPFNMTFDLPFLADIENIAAVEANQPSLTVAVTDESGSELHSQTRVYDDVPGCMTDENKAFPEVYAQPTEIGTYNVDYTVTTLNDENQDNDTQGGSFQITDREFKKVLSEEEAGGEYLDGIRYGGGSFQSWGSYFYVPEDYNGGQAIEEVRGGIVIAGGEEPGIGEIVCTVYEWVDINEDGGVNSGADNEKIYLGEATYLLTPESTDFRDFGLTPLTEDGEMIILEPGTELLVMFHTNPFSGEINYFGLNSPSEESISYATGASTLAYGELGLSPRYGSIGGVGASHDDRDDGRDFFSETRWSWYINAKLTPPTGTEDINENLSIEVFPSPASTVVNVDINLEEVSENVSIDVINMSGSNVGSYNYKNIKNDKLSIDVSEFPGGMYLMNIRTEEGMISKKVTVLH